MQHYEEIINNMHIKRLKINQKKSTFPYLHICCIIKGDNVISTGVNSERELYSGCTYSCHAETDAIYKLPPNNSKRIKNIDIIVIRVTQLKLKDSKPCSKCLEHMMKIKGYKIKNIYYSDNDGTIKCERLIDLYYSEYKHISHTFKLRQLKREMEIRKK